MVIQLMKMNQGLAVLEVVVLFWSDLSAVSNLDKQVISVSIEL